MDFEPAMMQELNTIDALYGKVYPLDAPEAVKKNGVPYLVYMSSEGVQDKTLGGYIKSKAVQAELNILAERYGDMKAITKQVVALLIGFEGREIGDGGPMINELTYESPVEMFENQPELYRCVIEFTAYFNEEDD